MAHLYDYGDGTTVTLAANTTVTGSGTLFLTAVALGDHFYGPGDAKPYEIVAITDDTHLTLDRAWAGDTGSGKSYFILRDSPLRSNSRTALVQLSDLLTTYQSIINITGNDRYFNLDKTASGDNAGLWIKQGGTSLFRVGAFGDNDLHFQWLNASTWTDALKITALGVLSFPSATGITSSSAQAFFVGRQGATNPAFLVDASASSSATGIKVTAAAAAGGVALSVNSSGTNENLTIDAKGLGTITLAATSTGSVRVARAFVLTGAEDSQLQWSLGGQDWRINIQSNGALYIYDKTASIAPLTIAKTTGKVTLLNDLVIGGTTAATSISTGSAVFGGGIGVAGAAWFGSVVSAFSYKCRTGFAGSYGANQFNLNWNGTGTDIWIDNTNAGTITVTSDYRIKRNIEDAEDALAEVLAWRPVKFRRRNVSIFRDTGRIEYGFVAHELQAASPMCVLGAKDAVNDAGEIVPQTLDTIPMIARLAKAVQESHRLNDNRIETVEQRIARLEDELAALRAAA